MKHFVYRLCWLLGLSTLLSSAALGQGLRFSLKDLDTFKDFASFANAINNNGQVVGTILDPTGTSYDCFSIVPGAPPDVFTSDFKSNRWCEAFAVNLSGQIAGRILTTKYPVLRAFRRDPSKKPAILPSLGGPYQEAALGINDYGMVVGYSSGGSGGAAETSVWWDTPSSVIDLGTGPSYATDINNLGQIVGNAVGSGFLYHKGTPLTLLPPLYPGQTTGAYAINDNGFIAGEGYMPGAYCAALWSGVASVASLLCTPVTIGTIPNALAISADNWAVGPDDYFCNGFRQRCGSFISVPGCPVAELNSLLDASGTGWNVWQATGINDKHQIVAWGQSPSGAVHAALLTPNFKRLCAGQTGP